LEHVWSRVARWHIFDPKIPIWVNFGGSSMKDIGILHRHLVYFTAIWYSLWLFGIVFPFWYFVPRKIWQPWFGALIDGALVPKIFSVYPK
jgi:hypothetical protein